MKLLFLTAYFYPERCYGGTVESNFNLLSNLSAQNDMEIEVLTVNVNDVLVSDKPIFFNGLKITYYSRTCWDYVSISMAINIFKKAKNCDVVYISEIYSFPTIIGIIAAKVFKKPLILAPHGTFQYDKTTKKVFLKKIWNYFCYLLLPLKTLIHITSKFEAIEVNDFMPGIPVVISPNIIKQIKKMEKTEGKDGVTRLLFLGRIDPKKGIENLIEALSLLKFDNWTLTIAGKGETKYEILINGLIRKRGLENKISMIGFVGPEEKSKLFSSVDATIVPSYKENFCHVVAESLSAGVPVVVSDQMPWKKVEEVGCGLVSSNDPLILSKTIEKLFSLPLKEMGERGHIWIAEKFCARKQAKIFKEQIEEFLDSKD